MKTLIIDGNWVLKKNFHKRKSLMVNGDRCGGVFGFLDSLKSVVYKIMPDRIVVAWDGFNGGKLRYEIYKPYKANRNKDFESEKRMIETNGMESEEDLEKMDILRQKIKVQQYLEEMYVRQIEVDYIEADDLIAQYCLLSQADPNLDELIIIYSRDGDFPQLVSEKVSVLSPINYQLITKENFKQIFGYLQENELMMKCFDGDDSDVIEGVKGITKKTLIKYFPRLQEEPYTYAKLVEEAYEKKEKKKLKVYDKIINARDVLYRNAKLMNLKKPFLNEQAKREVFDILYKPLTMDRSINVVMDNFVKDGYSNLTGPEMVDYFFQMFFLIMSKERNYLDNYLKSVIINKKVH